MRHPSLPRRSAGVWACLFAKAACCVGAAVLAGGSSASDADTDSPKTESFVSIGRIAADGVKVPVGQSGPVRIRAHTRMLDLDFWTHPAPNSAPLRYRFQLEGVDSTWRDPIGVMRFTVRFNDSSGNAVSGEEFDAHGESSGWNGAPEGSKFVPRRVSLDVPAGASDLQVWLSSAGPAQTMGVYALDSLAVTLIPRDPQREPDRFEFVSPTGSLMDRTSGTPTGWARHGTSLGIAQIAPREGRPPLIVMRDDRPDSFGGWLTTKAKSPKLEGIVRVDLEWEEAYSIGWGGSARQSYPYLPVGEYWMRLQALNLEGRPVGAPSATCILVVPPFYEARWFLGVMTLVGAGMTAGFVRWVTRRRMQRKLDALEKERIVERERSRIARDLHDNLGADLTHLALLSDLAQVDAADANKARKHFDQIFELARSLTREVDEIVWAVNPANDSLRGFVPFLSNYSQNFLLAAEIPCRIDIPVDLPEAHLSSAQRHNLFLVVKEALHNIVKHSGASEVRLRVRTEGRQLEIRVEDNGCGIPQEASSGDGTVNMQQRVEGIGASLRRESQPAKGTVIFLTLPLANLH